MGYHKTGHEFVKKRSKLDLSSGVDQDKPQAAGFGRATLANPATEPQYAERKEKNKMNANDKAQKSPAEPQRLSVQEAAEKDIDLRSSQANNIIKKHVIVAMGASLVPIPLFDLVALTSVQPKMLYSLTKLYDVPFSKNLGKSFIASLLGGIMPTSSAMTLARLPPTTKVRAMLAIASSTWASVTAWVMITSERSALRWNFLEPRLPRPPYFTATHSPSPTYRRSRNLSTMT